MKEKTNNTSPQGKANPGDTGQNKAGVKTSSDKTTGLNYKEQLAENYTEGDNQPASHLAQNPNRNTSKTKLDKPAYGGS